MYIARHDIIADKSEMSMAIPKVTVKKLGKFCELTCHRTSCNLPAQSLQIIVSCPNSNTTMALD